MFNKTTCPTLLVKILRQEHWNIEIIGETRSNPFHQFLIKPINICFEQDLSNSILIQLSGKYTNIKLTSYLQDGPYVAYLGPATKENVKKPTLDISAKTSYVKAYQQLILLKTWFQRLGCTNLIGLLNDLLKEKQV